MHVVFDLDGVLLDSESDRSWLDRALDATLEELGVEGREEHRQLLYPANLTTIEDAATRFGVSATELWATRDAHYTREKVNALRSGEIGPFPDIEVVRDLAAEYPLSIISNSPGRVIEVFLEASGLKSAFEHRIGRGRDLQAVGHLKPDTHFYELLERRAGMRDFVYVGDTESDATFAARTGMTYVHLDREGRDGREVEDGGNELGALTVCHTLHEVAERIRMLD